MATQNNAQSLDIEVALTKSEKFINQYKKQLIIAFVAIIAVAVAWFGGHRWMSNREDAAQTQLALGQQYFATGAYDVALKGDSVKGDDAFKGYLKIADEYTFTDAANLAHLYAGICYVQQGETKKAIEQLEKFSTKGDATVSANALGALANCYATDGQLDKAVSMFKDAAKKADSPALSPIFLMQAAGLLEKQGDKAGANKLYLQVKSDYPTSQYSSVQNSNGVVIGAEIDKYIERTK